MVDDELFALFCGFKAGVRVLVISDSCHSGTVSKAIPDSSLEPTRIRYLDTMERDGEFERNKEFYEGLKMDSPVDPKKAAASIQLLAGCQDNQFSMEGNHHGRFTEGLLKIWNNGEFSGSYEEFYTQIRENMPSSQIPNRVVYGDTELEWGTPFYVSS